MGQNIVELTYFKRVQHPMVKSRAKNIFPKVIRVVAKVYLCEKKIWGASSILSNHDDDGCKNVTILHI